MQNFYKIFTKLFKRCDIVIFIEQSFHTENAKYANTQIIIKLFRAQNLKNVY